MGVHHWTLYCSEEKHCMRTLWTIFDQLCFNCHTSKEVNGCNNCAMGKANWMMLNYLKKNYGEPYGETPQKVMELISICEKEDPKYTFLALIKNYSSKSPKKKYLDKVKEGSNEKLAPLHTFWAIRAEASDKIKLILEVEDDMD